MGNTKTKPSVKKIQEAFKKMLNEKSYEKITVQDVIEEAQISRSAFYSNFIDLNHLLEKMQEEIIDSFFKKNTYRLEEADIQTRVRYFIDYANELSEVSEKLLCSGSYYNICKNIQNSILKYQSDNLRGSYSKNPEVENLAFYFCSHTITGLYRHWVLTGKQVSSEILSETIISFLCNGLFEK